MKPISVPGVITFVFTFLLHFVAQGQTFGTTASAVWLEDCNQSNYFNTSDNGTGTIGPAANVFTNSNLGSHTQNSGTLILRGAEVRTFKTPGIANVCSVRMYYRIYPQAGIPGAFSAIDLPLADNCNIPTSQFPSGGACLAGEQKWNRVTADGMTTPYAPVNLTAFVPGNYFLEVYYDVSGSSVTTTLCNETVLLNNAGNNYKASFSIQNPTLISTNPTTCSGTNGFIRITGLTAGASYDVSYYDDGVLVGPVNYIADGSGQVIISGLNKGVYSDFELIVNGCTTFLNTGLILSDPVFTPAFFNIPPFCAGTTPPILPNTSSNGISGTWSPSVINNMTSGTYTFTPSSGQCGLTVVKNVTVRPNIVPTFSFGTSLIICTGGGVPVLPGTSTNSINGTWSPAVVDNMNSGVYTFTPAVGAGPCAIPTTFTVTVNPNITPTFSFGTSQTYCAGSGVPTLPGSSTNGITGSWSPAVVDNQNSGVYTFTPTGGQCATTATFTVTISAIVTPAFSFGTSLSICTGGTVPALPNTSTNGITGTWSPLVVDNMNSGVYTFTPSAGSCAPAVTFTVTVNQIITPTFNFGSAYSICAGGAVPVLPVNSTNGITGTWSPSIVDDQNSATYTFTPAAGQCAATTTFTVTVNPNVTPTFSFGTSQTYCAGTGVPALTGTSTNGITGTWSPSVVDNQNSGVYTFTPTAGQCATTTTFTVTINPVITPTFSFGTTLTICAGGSVPVLPNTSTNGITGNWSPSVVDNQNSANYTFTPTAGQCAASVIFSVTVTQNVVPTFNYGTSMSICDGDIVPNLLNTSNNGVTGIWTPAIVDNQNSGTYIFTPDAGQCATSTSFVVTVNPIVTPTFSFGSSLTICAGGTVPSLPNTSDNSITGSWSPATVDNQASGVYTFTPTAGQCSNTFTYTVTVTPNTIPVFSFGTTLNICTGDAVPALPTNSTNGITGTWDPAVVDNTVTGTYIFTPTVLPGQCITTASFIVTVNPFVTPAFSFGTSLNLCAGSSAPALPTTSLNGINGTWSPAVMDNQTSGTYTFTPASGACATGIVSVTVTVVPTASVGSRSDTTAYDGAILPPYIFSGTPAGVNFTWTNSNPAIGLPASGIGNVPSFTGTNMTANPITGTITVTPLNNGCAGTSRTYIITILPLHKDIFVPTVFSPNGDGKNDLLFAYSNYIVKLEMRIFNQWGEQIELITSRNQGWDGKYKGKPQPVGVYAYALVAVLTDGRTVKMKGSFTLLR